MERWVKPLQSTESRRALPVIALGMLVVFVPFIISPFPGSGGPITVAIRVIQAIASVVGLGLVAVGLYSYRTGNLRPAGVAVTPVVGVLIVGIAGGVIEMTSGQLVPIWAWFSATILVIALLSVAGSWFMSG